MRNMLSWPGTTPCRNIAERDLHEDPVRLLQRLHHQRFATGDEQHGRGPVGCRERQVRLQSDDPSHRPVINSWLVLRCALWGGAGAPVALAGGVAGGVASGCAVALRGCQVCRGGGLAGPDAPGHSQVVREPRLHVVERTLAIVSSAEALVRARRGRGWLRGRHRRRRVRPLHGRGAPVLRVIAALRALLVHSLEPRA